MKNLGLLLIPSLLIGCIDTGDDTSGTNVSVSETGNVEGSVSDSSSGAKLANVSVFIGASTTTTSNSSGTYSFSSVETGNRTITASLSGYKDYSGVVDVVKGTTVTHNGSSSF